MRMSLKELAEIFEVSESSIKNWLNEGLPQVARGQFDLAAMVGWVRRNKPLSENESNLTEERCELIKVQRQLKTLELMIKKQELIPRSEVLNEFLSRIHAVRSGLLGFSRSLPQMLVGKELRDIAEILKKEVYLLLEKFSRKGGVLKK